MGHHYHIVSRLDMTKFGGTTGEHYYGPGLPLTVARDDAQGLADERSFTKIAGGIWTDAPDTDSFNADIDGSFQSIQIDPCDNAMDFDIPWNAYKDSNHYFRRAPKGQPCSSLIKEEGWDFFV
jgi:hypothetical protein